MPCQGCHDKDVQDNDSVKGGKQQWVKKESGVGPLLLLSGRAMRLCKWRKHVFLLWSLKVLMFFHLFNAPHCGMKPITTGAGRCGYAMEKCEENAGKRQQSHRAGGCLSGQM